MCSDESSHAIVVDHIEYADRSPSTSNTSETTTITFTTTSDHPLPLSLFGTEGHISPGLTRRTPILDTLDDGTPIMTQGPLGAEEIMLQSQDEDDESRRLRQESTSSSATRNEDSPSSHISSASSRTSISLPPDSFTTARALGTASASAASGRIYDLICIGFGPAALSIAIALADKYTKSSLPLPRVLFLERQPAFAWHSGMQLPSAKMQISFLKDLATPRDPTSQFSFLNYLHQKGRFSAFVNLGTFLPSRGEYEDYMRWCAGHFDGLVAYGAEVEAVTPTASTRGEGGKVPKAPKVGGFEVRWKTAGGPNSNSAVARNVVVALGGEAAVPEVWEPHTTSAGGAAGAGSSSGGRVHHSSRYATAISKIESALRIPSTILKSREEAESALRSMQEGSLLHSGGEALIATIEALKRDERAALSSAAFKLTTAGLTTARPRFVVVGGGQSGAEIFADLCERFPDSEVRLVIRDSSLRPSDDSPFVNEIFDPERVDEVYGMGGHEREARLGKDKATNYSVVRLELLEKIYEAQYGQKMRNPDPGSWRCRILPSRKVVTVERDEARGGLRLGLAKASATASATAGTAAAEDDEEVMEELEADYVFLATGYTRRAHERVLAGTKGLLPAGSGEKFEVQRNYKVIFDPSKIDERAGVWLQGCCERTHGVSFILQCFTTFSLRLPELLEWQGRER
jgi:L-ornithine N5-oxygenase